MNLRNPPKIKVLEALGAIADGRVKLINEEECEVISSEGDRKYKVFLKGSEVYSDDNGTKFRNYVGYPIISCLMIKGLLSFNEKYSNALKGIPWRKLNEEYKKYEKVEEIVFKISSERGISKAELESFIKTVISQIANLHLKKMNI